MKVKFAGDSDVRVIYKADWEKVGVNHEMVKWDASNNFEAEVDEKAGQWLLDNDPDFKAMDSKSSARMAASPLEKE